MSKKPVHIVYRCPKGKSKINSLSKACQFEQKLCVKKYQIIYVSKIIYWGIEIIDRRLQTYLKRQEWLSTMYFQRSHITKPHVLIFYRHLLIDIWFFVSYQENLIQKLLLTKVSYYHFSITSLKIDNFVFGCFRSHKMHAVFSWFFIK